MKKLILILIIAFPVFSWAEKVPMVCEWNLWFDEITEKDTFIFDVEDKTVFWVNEDKKLKIELTEGLIKFEGVPYSRVRIDKEKYKTHIPINFTINRITGEFKVDSVYGKPNYESKCTVKKPLL